jgi:prophage regulatory protein
VHKGSAQTKDQQAHLPSRASRSAKAGPSPTSATVRPQPGAEQNPSALPSRFLRFPEIRARTGLWRSTIWRMERRGDFPRHRRISPNSVAWLEEELTTWIRARVGTD